MNYNEIIENIQDKHVAIRDKTSNLLEEREYQYCRINDSKDGSQEIEVMFSDYNHYIDIIENIEYVPEMNVILVSTNNYAIVL